MSENGEIYTAGKNFTLLPALTAWTNSTSVLAETLSYKLYTAHCVLCAVYFSAQLNKLRPILNLKKYYPIQHIFVPACSSARKIHFFKF